MQTVKGYDRIGIVKQVAKEPWSYIVESNGKEYRRNRRHLLAVPEPYYHIKEEPDEPDGSTPFESSPQPVSNLPTVNMVPDENYAVPQQAASIPLALSNLQGEAMINQRITFSTDDVALVDIIIRLFHFGIRLL
jgi:hypothetical protein